MININTYNKASDKLKINKLLNSLPKSSLASLNITGDRIEVVTISGDNVDKISKAVENIGGKYEDLGYGFGIVTISVDKLGDLIDLQSINYVELPKSLYESDSNSNNAACITRTSNSYNLYGEGVVVGFIDSGIDFTHPAFINDDGTTRIDYIYDLSTTDKVYDNNTINEALKSRDPYSIVPVVDVTEHGTHVAGIACAGGKIDKKYYGVAPKSSIMMVKSTRGQYALSTQIMRGLKFLVDKGKELRKPLVVNLSLSTNNGAHNGTSLLEQYINTIAILERITIVIAAGNEGDASHHVGGRLKKENIIKLNIASDEKQVFLNLYKSVLPNATIEIISPVGTSSGIYEVKEGLLEGRVGGDKYQIFVTGPKPFDVNGEVLIILNSLGEYLIEGQWTLKLRTIDDYIGNFDIWLPVTEGLNKKTKFLEPTVENTLGIPATVQSVISVGSYNQLTDTISSFSGRGRQATNCNIKPDIVAPGENISAPVPNRSFDSKSGTSMATPHVTGAAALLMEWGVVKGNDVFLYGDRLKYYLIEGAKKGRRDIPYPDIAWGFGELCLFNSLDRLMQNLRYDSFIEKGFERLGNDYEIYDFTDYLNKYKDSTEIIGLLVEFTSKETFLKLNELPRTSAIVLNDSFGIVYTPFNKIKEVLPFVKKIPEVLNPAIYTLENISPVEASGATTFNNNPYLPLNGQGVIIGIIDTGIDYLNSEFMKEDDTTRITRIWDQSIESGKKIYGLELGTEYTEEQINDAIKLKKEGGDPYSIVNTKDEIGHGTMVAGLAAGRGANPQLVGAAPGSEIAVVKLQEASNVLLEGAGVALGGKGRYEAIDITVAIRYLSQYASSVKKPIVIIVSLGSNVGPHDGKSLLEGVIDSVASQYGVIIVTGVGNEGDTDTHVEGELKNKGETKVIELKVGKRQKDLNFEIWIAQPDKVSLSVTSPSGEVVEKIPAKLQGTENIKFIYEGTKMAINYSLPDNITGDELILIRCRNLKEGIWRFSLIGDYIVDGRYWSWLPQRSLLDQETKFLSPSQYTTLTSPATSYRAIVAAYYNQNNNATVGSAGRGYTRDGRIKPDVAAGGINALVIAPGGGIKTVSGSSVATAVLGGVCALLLQWGLVEGNDKNLNSVTLRSYIIRGAKMRGGDSHPNREWGYGMLDVNGIFDAIRGNYRRDDNNYNRDNYDEYNCGNCYIRKPTDI